MNILWVGSGQLAQAYMNNHHDHEMIGFRRTPQSFHGVSHYQEFGVNVFSEQALLESFQKIPKPDVIIYSVTPQDRSKAAYEQAYLQGLHNVRAALQSKGWQPFWLHIGSCGVFGQQYGEWVSEKTQPLVLNWRQEILMQSEAMLHDYSNHTILRLGGIYGGGREALLRRTFNATKSMIEQPQGWSNRIHVVDVIGLIYSIIQQHLIIDCPKIIHGVDHAPAILSDVMTYIAQQKFQKRLLFKANGAETYSHKQQGVNKRVKSLGRSILNYRLKVPSYYDGYFQ